MQNAISNMAGNFKSLKLISGTGQFEQNHTCKYIFRGDLFKPRAPKTKKNIFRSSCISIAIVGKTVSKSGCNTATTIEIKFTGAWKYIFKGGSLIATVPDNTILDIVTEPPMEMLLRGQLDVRCYKLHIFAIDAIVVVPWTDAENHFWPLVKNLLCISDRCTKKIKATYNLE